jgi:hypothetical protein
MINMSVILGCFKSELHIKHVLEQAANATSWNKWR